MFIHPNRTRFLPTFLLLCGFAALAPARAQEAPLRGFVVCVDPGHASETSQGTTSRDGRLTELHVNWVVAQRLITLLKADGATVVTTKIRESQVVTNRRRAEIANAAHANVFLRLHCDSGEQSGLATYYPDRQGTRFGVTGPSLSVVKASLIAASVFQPAVIAALHGDLRDAGIKGDSKTGVGSKQGALTGSIFSHVPALTVEMCVLTNAHDYRFIRTNAGQEEMARALLAGVEAYARVYFMRKLLGPEGLRTVVPSQAGVVGRSIHDKDRRNR